MATKTHLSKRRFGKATLLLTALHLFTYWVFGLATVVVLITLFSRSLSLLIVGIGFLLFPLLTTLMLWVARFERHRAASLYDLQVPKINPVRPDPADYASVDHSLLASYLKIKLQQFVEPQMWRALSSFLLNTLLGLFMIASLQFGIFFIAQAIDEITAADSSPLVAITTVLYALFLLLLAPALVYVSAWATTKLFTTQAVPH